MEEWKDGRVEGWKDGKLRTKRNRKASSRTEVWRLLRRIAVEHRFEKVSVARSRLTEKDKQFSEVEQAQGRRPLEPLLPGDRVITGGIVELTLPPQSFTVIEAPITPQ